MYAIQHPDGRYRGQIGWTPSIDNAMLFRTEEDAADYQRGRGLGTPVKAPVDSEGLAANRAGVLPDYDPFGQNRW